MDQNGEGSDVVRSHILKLPLTDAHLKNSNPGMWIDA